MKKLVCGILAHVDSGKTTLSEALLYIAGMIKTAGRVDKRDAFLDHFELERERGITIFSKQAVIRTPDFQLTLVDTPGHADFSAETERALQILDAAILVVSGPDRIQGQTEALWRQLARYRIPTFLFINKTDLPCPASEELMEELTSRLSAGCIDFSTQGTQTFYEQAALCSEQALEQYLTEGMLRDDQIAALIAGRELFPCFFGSALRMQGVQELYDALKCFVPEPVYRAAFGARVYKISRDEQGNRLTWMKLTGGFLSVRDIVAYESGGQEYSEKINQIRIYSGARYEAAASVKEGELCAVTGLSATAAGEGLGEEKAVIQPFFIPVLTCRLILPDDVSAAQFLPKLRMLEEEEPQLHVCWNEQLSEIHVQLMGKVQTEVLQKLISQRFDVSVQFGAERLMYRETLACAVEGVGHYEPLKHYAEVHLLMEPGEPGSGLVFASACSEEILDRNWQRLVLTHLEEKEHIGVLTGSPVTDMKITLVSGRAHLKHTEGGDFRQATYRAVRQGLRSARCVLLEPYYQFRLRVPAQQVGRAMTDMEKRHARFGAPSAAETDGMMTLEGVVPVSEMSDYAGEIAAYTKGRGMISLSIHGYEPCHNAEEVVSACGYDPEADMENPTGSVFCAHGAGFYVPWDEVYRYMHVEAVFTPEKQEEENSASGMPAAKRNTEGVGGAQVSGYGKENGLSASDFVKGTEERIIGTEEIDSIIKRSGGANRKENVAERKIWSRRYDGKKTGPADEMRGSGSRVPEGTCEEYLLVDGYNVIFAWEDLRELAEVNVDAARGRLLDILCNYQAMRGCEVIVVFDAYRVQGHAEEFLDYHNIHVVFTKEAETADQYIEKFAHQNSTKYRITVATSDGLEQIIIRGQGCALLSSRELLEEIRFRSGQFAQEHMAQTKRLGNSMEEKIKKLEQS